ncbi:MAG: hypothetical protein ABS68_00005 [Niastella sp. SCN 39-18]|nr:sigma-70 family RNA polymerase sigma factor [Sphingobacteriales bacterium]ODT55137.1 MAG: hypothetical protein ABS68_00005 [Niastella sp. SCN 39-18]OJW09152.1 MAG: hypothetical protein BGO53_00400 [Sphingobacteriales bacterium 39-19]
MTEDKNSNTERKIKELTYQISRYDDQTAYKALFFILFPSLQNFVFSILKSRVWAEEIASDLLMDVWMKRERLEEIENLKVYLFVSARHAALARLKQEHKMDLFSLDDVEVEFISDYTHPGQATEFSELEYTIAKTVKELPPACQLIYKLAKEDRLKYKEIAQILDLSVKTIDNQLAIAIKRIAESIRVHKKTFPSL